MHPLILIVDDEANIRHSLMRLMEGETLHALAAPDAETAFSLLDKHPVDVVIADERMPGMSGTDFLIRVRDRWPHTIRIMLTGQASVEDAARAINEGGIFRFLLKPWDDEQLLDAIIEGLALRGGLDAQVEALRRHQRRRRMIEQLERQYPGIGTVRRNPDGSIML